MNVRWVIQSNLLAEDDINLMRAACAVADVEFFPVKVVPFSADLPDFPLDEKVNIYYGSTTFISRVDEALKFPLGVFFCSEAFQMSNYNVRWGEHMLNYEAKVTTLGEFKESKEPPLSEWFIRPNADDKSFAGEVFTFEQAVDWAERVERNAQVERESGNVPALHGSTPILAGPAYRVQMEWRNYIVDGKVVTSSRYRQNHKLSKKREAPQDMIDFVHARCAEYVPNRVFVMDIAYCGGKYYIVECGCLNSAGLYDADVNEIVRAVSNAIIR